LRGCPVHSYQEADEPDDRYRAGGSGHDLDPLAPIGVQTDVVGGKRLGQLGGIRGVSGWCPNLTFDTLNRHSPTVRRRKSQTMKFRLKHALAAIILMLSPVSPAAAGPFEDAVMAYGRGDYATAMQLFRPLAEQGNAIAQFNLGVMYHDGKGVPQDYTEAMKWYRLAADQGGAGAQYNLALMYKDGESVPRDYVHAYMWFSLSATHGYQEAVKGRDFFAQTLTPAQLAEAQKLAREWKATMQPPR